MAANDIIVALLPAATFGGYLANAVIPRRRWASNRRWIQRRALLSTPELATLVEQQRSRRSWALAVVAIGLLAALIMMSGTNPARGGSGTMLSTGPAV